MKKRSYYCKYSIGLKYATDERIKNVNAILDKLLSPRLCSEIKIESTEVYSTNTVFEGLCYKNTFVLKGPKRDLILFSNYFLKAFNQFSIKYSSYEVGKISRKC